MHVISLSLFYSEGNRICLFFSHDQPFPLVSCVHFITFHSLWLFGVCYVMLVFFSIFHTWFHLNNFPKRWNKASEFHIIVCRLRNECISLLNFVSLCIFESLFILFFGWVRWLWMRKHSQIHILLRTSAFTNERMNETEKWLQ